MRELKIGDTVKIRKQITPEKFAANMEFRSKYPLQRNPKEFEFELVTIQALEDLEKYRGMA